MMRLFLGLIVFCSSAVSAQAQLLTGFYEPVVTSAAAAPVEAEPIAQPFPSSLGQKKVRKPQQFLTGPFAGAGAMRAEQAQSEDVESASEDQPVDLQADDLIYDERSRIVTASGNVVLEQAGRRLIADRVSYSLSQDRVVASGNVEVMDVNGDLHKAERIELEDDLKDGVVEELESYLVDGARFTASRGIREGAVKTTMRSASYTPCEICEEDPDADPLWQLRASEVKYDQEDHRVEYRNARLEFFGVPMVYTPYFSHPDGTVKRKSGFLSPHGGYKSDLGLFVNESYYYDIAPDKDATIGLRVHTKENPLLLGQWRQGWDDAELQIDGSITYAERKDLVSGERITQDEEARGHLFAAGIWDLDEKWRTGLNVEYASDDQYLRQYDFSSEDVLENDLYVERFSGRNYATARILTFQDVRIRDRVEDQPEVVPEMIASFVGDPGSMPLLGGRWELETSFLGLRREGDEQDVNRFSLGGGWQRKLVSDIGLLTNVQAHIRGDAYNVRDRSNAPKGSGLSDNETETRFFPQMHVETSYPLARPYENFQAVIEPVIALTLAPNLDTNDSIPNEDSRDIQLDISNLFEPNRFPGFDVVEDKNRVTYGLRTGLYGYDGSHLRLFLGQSRRFDEDDNPFPVGSGLDEKESDYVGEVSGNYKNKYFANYEFQYDQDNFAAQRHEADFYGVFDEVTIGSRYLFAKALEGTDIEESREQIQAGVSHRFAENWKWRGGSIYDLGADPGMREAYLGFDYLGQCLSWSLVGERNLTEDASGESSSEIMFRIGLKNLGDFATSAFDDYLDEDLRP